MELAADVDDADDVAESPRYLAVEQISDHKHEKELLFIGKRVKLRITNIIRSGTHKGHRSELSLLYNIQKLLRNGCPRWSANEVGIFREDSRLQNMEYVHFL